jgi:proteic killer suppression protein
MAIQSFADRETEALFRTGRQPRYGSMVRVALRKLDYLNAAEALNDLRSPPGNRLEILRGDRAGQHSIRINDQWRICFEWTETGPARVGICDYH